MIYSHRRSSELGKSGGPSDTEAILAILHALELGEKKEERELLDAVLANLGVERKTDAAKMAEAILANPGFEAFLFAVLQEVRPFALMLQEIYGFLNRASAVATRRASLFRVSAAGARKHLDFSLDNFPRELLAVLSRVEFLRYRMELRFPDAKMVDGWIDWDGSPAEAAWRAIAPIWDNDFYDGGFHRALSYAPTILGEQTRGPWDRFEEIVGAIMDRLATIVRYVSASHPLEFGEASFNLGDRWVRFTPGLPALNAYGVAEGEGLWVLDALHRSRWQSDQSSTVFDELRYTIYGLAISLHLLREERLQRSDRDEWLEQRLGRPLESISPDLYLDFLEDLAADYRSKLDVVAPVVAEDRLQGLEERLMEFLLLPFWKNRWFVYELWTLVLVLKTAEEVAPQVLLGLREGKDGFLEWELPGGKAATPVAAMGGGDQRVVVWPQKQTYHPATGAQLEPDLRLSAENPPHHDLMIIENKDRRKPPTRDMVEIAERYVSGTCATSVWLLNYDRFTSSLNGLPQRFPERRLEVISEFRPEQVPERFLTEIRHTLTSYLGLSSPVKADRTAEQFSVAAELRITLTWGEKPRDLDLHGKLVRAGSTGSISYGQRGSLEEFPFALLDADVTTGHGREEIRALTADLERLEVAVHHYSSDGSLVSSGAVVEIEGLGHATLRVAVPVQGGGRWWHCFVLDLRNGVIEVTSRLDDHAMGASI